MGTSYYSVNHRSRVYRFTKLEKGDESRAKNLDNRKTLAGQMDYEYYYEDFKEWFCPLFDPYISAYQIGSYGEGLTNI